MPISQNCDVLKSLARNQKLKRQFISGAVRWFDVVNCLYNINIYFAHFAKKARRPCGADSYIFCMLLRAAYVISHVKF